MTIRTVARRAGVSAMTVSNVLNGRKVAPETRAAVQQAIAELNYTPNPAARQLATASAVAIGVLHARFEHSFFSELLVGALNAAAREGAQILLQPVDVGDASGAWDAVRALRDRGANAILLPSFVAETMARSGELEEPDLPLAAIAPGERLAGIASVRIDEFAAAQEVTELLIAKGRRRIGFIGPPEGLGLSPARRDGYLAALQAHGLAADPALRVAGGRTLAASLAAADALLDLQPRPDAIFAWNDDFAASALTAAHRRGLDVPGDLAVAGFDDSPLASKVWPPLTTVRQPLNEMAAWAVQTLVRQVRGEAAAGDALLPHAIIRRASTGD
ncbi:LacI family DNA-binding transcriptional regulator [Phenylobacterium sp. LjRoot219]|uniref:LacI family DNA-binding transcriptional regulator n=1 Tax=Phenylobacterium sp. LjRoot219 TaxID=3342283 RepID=UPI003ECCF7E8